MQLQKDKSPSWQEGTEAWYRHGGRSRKLRVHVFKAQRANQKKGMARISQNPPVTHFFYKNCTTYTSLKSVAN